ncbi:MAG: bifunctional oligoribonuclease/PAP phosphatase NrnA [Desulfobacterota bacterium]|nr:bifunctional oligoribonuclease/PAP phosphatase NrnA [Thermodesulfobacteriota bacterium]MDW8001920.1 bifunctional oligoribonuclease/PAP phosphatase NrnA [Deltaproteobacteria bacterium]
MPQKIKKILKKNESFLLCTHVDPDGDALGSLFATYFWLRQMGKSVRVYLEDRIPYRYAFLPRPESLEVQIRDLNFDAVFVLDCGDISRLGKSYELISRHTLIINIDHHETNRRFGKINYVRPNASSTAEIIFNIFSSLGTKITWEIAINIYTAIFTDTGSFRFPNTNAKAFQICGKLVRYGISPAYVAEMVYENHPKERFLLLSEVLRTLEVSEGGKVGIALITSDMYRRANASYEHSDGFVEYIKELRDVKLAIVIRELENGKCKVSMRSKDDLDVARICQTFGGGGHKNAAGCVLEGRPDKVKEIIKETVLKKV